jgi:hypothetical protein
MATISVPHGRKDALLERAERLGFRLVSREVDTGQLIWEWQPLDGGPCPQFVSERVALHWMSELIERFEGDRARHGW